MTTMASMITPAVLGMVSGISKEDNEHNFGL